MKRVPIVPTALVAAAIAAMIALGVWQLHRRAWKEAMLARYAQAATLPPVAFPRFPKDQSALFRRSQAFCLQPTGWRASAGRDLGGRSGYRHVADCRTGAEGPGVAIDMGWSNRPQAPVWRGGTVSGVIGPDRGGQVLLVSDAAAPGLVPSAKPEIAAIANNHLAYAIQWFLFAAVAAAVYVAALLTRGRNETDPIVPDRE